MWLTASSPSTTFQTALANMLRDIDYTLDGVVITTDPIIPGVWNCFIASSGIRLVESVDTPGVWPDPDDMVVARFERSGLPAVFLYMLDVQSRIAVNSLTGQAVSVADTTEYQVAGWGRYRYTPINVSPSPAKPFTSVDINGIQYQSYGKLPRKMYVCNPKGADLIDFDKQIDTFRDFTPVTGKHLAYGDTARIMGEAHHPVKPLGTTFLIPQDPYNVWGEFTRTGRPVALQGFKSSDFSLVPPKPIDTPPVEKKPSETPQTIASDYLRDEAARTFRYLRDDKVPVTYQVMLPFKSRSLVRSDAPTISVTRGRSIQILGTFRIKGVVYLLPILNNGINPFDWYYGIVEITSEGPRLKRFVEKVPDTSDITDDGTTTVLEKKAVQNRRRPGVDDILVSIGEVVEIRAERGVQRIKKHIERITSWKF